MISSFSSEQSFDRMRSLNDPFALAARGAAEQMLLNGQEIQAHIAAQIGAARERFVSCLGEMADCDDAAAASQVGAAFMMDSLRAFGDNMSHWNQFLIRSCRIDSAARSPAQPG